MRASAIRACIKRSKGSITKATLNRVAINDCDILKHLAVACKRLDYLEVRQRFLGKSVLEACPVAINLKTLLLGSGCEVTQGTFEEVIDKCVNLDRAEFGAVHSGRHRFHWPERELRLRTLRLGGTRQQMLGSFVLNIVNLSPRVTP